MAGCKVMCCLVVYISFVFIMTIFICFTLFKRNSSQAIGAFRVTNLIGILPFLSPEEVVSSSLVSKRLHAIASFYAKTRDRPFIAREKRMETFMTYVPIERLDDGIIHRMSVWQSQRFLFLFNTRRLGSFQIYLYILNEVWDEWENDRHSSQCRPLADFPGPTAVQFVFHYLVCDKRYRLSILSTQTGSMIYSSACDEDEDDVPTGWKDHFSDVDLKCLLSCIKLCSRHLAYFQW